MKKIKLAEIMALTVLSILIVFGTDTEVENTYSSASVIPLCDSPKGCVFRTLFGEEKNLEYSGFETPEHIHSSLGNGLKWLISAQHPNGGWGAGSHYNQGIMDPHKVNTDPATTAMVGMALLRGNVNIYEGPYSEALRKALLNLLEEVENTPPNRKKITAEENTQIQTKLGDNIDAVLTIQFFSNIIDDLYADPGLQKRVKKSLNICVEKIESLQQQDGSFSGDGWAGVLQSALATNALESAEHKGAEVDEDILNRSKEYQKGNYDPSSGNVNTDRGAGVMLYSVSGSNRASAKQARKAKEDFDKAKKDGKIQADSNISVNSLMDIGYSRDEAMRYSTAYNVYESSKEKAQDDAVISGFGNNGGEEFLSYLQTGESLVINDDASWTQWYDKTSDRLIKIQNEDGSWNGHHCITSPVFCTATTLMILSIHNDVEELLDQGKNQ